MLTQLSIYHLRNLQSVSFKAGICNVFIGANGSGKTSLLESLYLLSRGKSFRHHQPKRYISHHQPHTTVHARLSNGESMAIQKSQDASTVLRLGQQPVYVQSELTRQLPTLLIDPSSMDILEVGSSSRRQLLDWITFHVKQGFHPQWVAYQRLLKQRNALLKKSHNLSGLQKQELASWDKGLANHAALITHYRQQVFEAWQPLFDGMVKQLLPDYAPYIQLRFIPGYNTDVPLDELLQRRLQQDIQMGYTRIGCHRADIQVLWVDNAEARQEVHEQSTDSDNYKPFSNDVSLDSQGLDPQRGELNQEDQHTDDETDFFDATVGTVREQAANVLSRGEKKLLITALRLSQLPLLAGENQLPFQEVQLGAQNLTMYGKQPTHNLPAYNFYGSLVSTRHSNQDMSPNNEQSVLPLVLLDDITAELDKRALDILLQTLAALSCQVFITSLDDSLIDQVKHYWSDVNMFHVKHGNLQAIIED